ncbi:GTPase Era [Chitinivibrio alkaliphilus]|uniref:GTPase Era n=1 Tax=Chitinivibrio alkaliphilus ACht1 TaxID=1313304 RepID=U7D8V2_9BACT|nr:GTPase Era [Chitinivibrio alkaliphilus]ERP31532.1 GTP-binding protein Era [Chitinivibrio alkaliphilus ACht1]
MSDSHSFKSAFIALIGRPNSGKSTLLNAVLEENLAIVSPLPQTTQKNMNGVYTEEDLQIVFVDTPGIHMGKHRLNKSISQYGLSMLHDEGITIVCYLIDISRKAGAEEAHLAALAEKARTSKQVVLIFNKVDLFTLPEVEERIAAFLADYPGLTECPRLMVSAKAPDARDVFVDFLRPFIPEGPRYFSPDEITDAHLRYFAAEYVRLQIIGLTYREVPHASHVEITSYTEEEGVHHINADIHVETKGQKAILIGNKGTTIGKIRRQAEWRMRKLTGEKVQYQLFVKVTPHWRDNASQLNEFGFIE